ncbi:eukaryotic translation initiation factor 4E-binding protein Mextli-like [Ctenocephalides felis]|uniref:eukaryotic translation initiation factor 4E-binding protein Mextli-like n=1 Tax=Ctenocephalides felis TaxID=7515 RepID=UPI000E6E42BF|nr:eukaryotic translation initiation factor 4E-binding protein Mextli-like [Ctenocephalides felis]
MANITKNRKNIEPPRPLKSAQKSTMSTQDNQVTDEYLISFAETLSNTILTNPTDQSSLCELMWLSNQLKLRGPILEVNYGDSLDKIFFMFRNVLQFDNLNYNIRLPLLQLVELRANRWKCTDGVNSYYRPKVSKIQETSPIEPVILSTSPEPFSNIAPGQQLLEQGEVVRASGKYNKPTKIQGKNYFKDEVVIRNADSGKVMGIKGRRVHMIEELSETIISFQRVNPGAKERLVQITGPSEEKINYGKQLIEETIRRNASPVRSPECIALLGGGDYEPDPDVRNSIMANQDDNTYEYSRNRSASECAPEEFKYSVIIGNEVIKITGTCLNYVTAAKLELDKFFSNTYFETANKNNVENGEVFLTAKSDMIDEITDGFGNGFTISEEAPSKPIERRKYFHRKSSEFKDYPEPSVNNGLHKYSHETLVNLSKTPLSRIAPKSLDVMSQNNINRATKTGETFDAAAYFAQEKDCPQTTVISASDVKAESPDPE